MRKKGDISVNTIVMAAIAIFVLLVLIIVFKDQLKGVLPGFTYAGNDAKGGIMGTKCETIIGDRVCETSTKYTEYMKNTSKYELTPLPKPNNGTWSDCKDKTCYEVRDIS